MHAAFLQPCRLTMADVNSPAHDKVQDQHEAHVDKQQNGPSQVSAQADPERRHPLTLLPHTAR